MSLWQTLAEALSRLFGSFITVPGTTFHPVTPDRWPDLDRLFSESAGEELGNPSRCWCMEWRLASYQQWREQCDTGENRQAMREFVESRRVPGIIAYIDGEPAGWCSISPRSTLIGLKDRHRDFEDPGIWSVLCFYVPEKHRGAGLIRKLLKAAVKYAASQGARIVEGYPMAPELAGDGAAGTTIIFEKEHFERSEEMGHGQVKMRYHVSGEDQ
jgi:GNAT superfamily N-acetyltransferase